jgi:ribosome biogenesis protein Nip4
LWLTFIEYIAPRLVIGRVYKYLNEKMKFLWSKDLKLNTVHVRDVSNASWHLAEWYVDNHEQGTDVPIFNLADKQDTGNQYKKIKIQLYSNILYRSGNNQPTHSKYFQH